MATSRREAGAGAVDPDVLAIAALSHVATDAKALARFFALTGLDPQSLREAAGSPGFAAGVLDFVLADERLLLALAAEQDLSPEAIVEARQQLDAPRPMDEGWPPPAADDWA